ncbi:hypothetical protein C9374_004293 [Naegleria lovaniensis]|uniref:Uncharacterized protein n=1 Tax=Naegleria lovaniensis TaxID=51637 RepID=A0AA88GS83_NAELO|nr:uncharacterized protein C9374_004293 [Naegleria lovaniensis]KAG2383622.1 hypothetical protein C9374_004293 [Naegleria lovaniensis]
MKKPSSASSSFSTNIQYQHTKFPPIHKRASSSQASPQSGLNSNCSTPKNALTKRPTSAESSSSKHSAQSFELPIGAFLTSLPSSKLNSHRTPGTKRTISTPESSQLSVNVSLTSLEHIPLGTCRSECPSPVTKNVHDDDCISVLVNQKSMT